MYECLGGCSCHDRAGVAGFNHFTGSFACSLGRFLRLEPSHNVSRPDMCCLSNDWTGI